VSGELSLREVTEVATADAERQAIRQALEAAKGNKSQAARLLRTDYTTLHAKMKRYGISARDFQDA
jgi:two-component system nitrogen regulation response regulator GlnG